MAKLMYGAHALKCMIAGDAGLLARVARDQERHEIFTSCVALGRVLDAAERLADPIQRRNWTTRLRDDVPAQFGARLLPFGYDAALAWSGLRAGLRDADFDEHELMDVAVATVNGCAFVAPVKPWHAAVAGMAYMGPWTTSTSRPSPTRPAA